VALEHFALGVLALFSWGRTKELSRPAAVFRARGETLISHNQALFFSSYGINQKSYLTIFPMKLFLAEYH